MTTTTCNATPVFCASLSNTGDRAPQDLLGESPVWDHRLQTLYWVDILGGAVNSWCPAFGSFHRQRIVPSDGSDAVAGDYPGFCVPVASPLGTLLCGSQHGLFMLDMLRPRGRVERIAHPERTLMKSLRPRNRFNDGKTAPCGRLFAGTLQAKDNAKAQRDANSGSMFRAELADDADAPSPQRVRVSLVEALGGITLTNGLCWWIPPGSAHTSQSGIFYHIDTQTSLISRYPYNGVTGEVLKSSSLAPIDFKAVASAWAATMGGVVGRPDGMCIDSDGFLWVAAIEAGRVLRIDPEQLKVVAQVVVPTPLVTSCCFGGHDLKTLFITTAIGTTADAVAAARQKSPADVLAGALFSVRLDNVVGLPMTPFGAKQPALGSSKL